MKRALWRLVHYADYCKDVTPWYNHSAWVVIGTWPLLVDDGGRFKVCTV